MNKSFILAFLVLAGLNAMAFVKLAKNKQPLMISSEITKKLLDTNLQYSAKPQLFAPGLLKVAAPRNSAPAFSPSGNMVYLGQSQLNGDCTVMQVSKEGTNWSALRTASFSGEFRDLEPAFSPNGKYLIFASNRPDKPTDSVLTGHYNGRTLPKGGGNLWKVNFSDNGTSRPERLPDIINASSAVFSPCIVSDGSLYFMRSDSGAEFHIYRSQYKNGIYQTPVKLPFAMENIGDYDPVVAPDESFMIFSSSRSPTPKVTDLFIMFKNSNGWGVPIDLRNLLSKDVFGIEARLSPDLQTLYFSNSQNSAGVKIKDEQFIWRIDISDLLKVHHINVKTK